jgi:hypothetical protein
MICWFFKSIGRAECDKRVILGKTRRIKGKREKKVAISDIKKS